MNWQRTWAVARKEFIQILRDKRSLGMAIAIPMLMLGIFGYALTLDVDRVPLVVWDQSRSPASRELISNFTGSRYFSLRGPVGAYREIEHAINTGEALMAMVIPVDFEQALADGRPAPVQIIVDGSDANTATIAMGYASIVTLAYSQAITLREIRHGGVAAAAPPLDLRPRVWFNEELESRNFIIPGLIAVIMMIIAALLTSLTLAREWERGTMEQLISTPLRGCELILGKLIPYFVIGLVDLALAVLMGEFMFGVPLRGSVGLLCAMSAIFLAGSLALGLLISIMTKSQLLANQLALVLTFLPAFLLSGFMFAIPNMPIPIQLFTYLIPARYFITMLKGIYLKGIGLEILAWEAVFLTIFGVIIVVLANAAFKKKVA
ncbi:MAG: ABC transporter permease [Kiritimatiellae bacterium]|nr:ABC transporter permease [Kiritimatiellia bacterium]